MVTMWRWFYRIVVGIGVLFAILSITFVIGMNRPHVRQSDGFTGVTPDAIAATVSQTLPESATYVRYCRSSVGLGGRMLAYRFSAPIADLHTHSETEFAAHWDKLSVSKTPNSSSPITESTITFLKSGYGVDADWLLPPDRANGTLYKSADGTSSHAPTIFVDEKNNVLYFLMTD